MWSFVLQVIVLDQPTTPVAISGAALILVAIIAPLAEMEVRRRRNVPLACRSTQSAPKCDTAELEGLNEGFK
jgi:hypothetical protein